MRRKHLKLLVYNIIYILFQFWLQVGNKSEFRVTDQVSKILINYKT